ncbi:hypothetical protein LEP1GSC116_5001 [Leptospira interrogans serovar Icterohaemorrhagiae str. Verdun HP]|nr:hypothetical protein [Leptospira interrogans]EMO04779.1 hypothetical protein LEP1GSC116_5001 [Leptospira interrogans serovar Icterohaemorrhagiae str. Verdun HP]
MNAAVVCSFPIPFSRRKLNDKDEWTEGDMRRKISDALVVFSDAIRMYRER